MNGQMSSAEEALAEIRRRQQRTIRDALEVPWWYFAGEGTSLVACVAVIEMGMPDWVWWLVFTLSTGLSVHLMLQHRRRLRDLMWDRPAVALGVTWFVTAVVLFVTVWVAAALIGSGYPATIGAVVTTIAIVLTGPPTSRRIGNGMAARLTQKLE